MPRARALLAAGAMPLAAGAATAMLAALAVWADPLGAVTVVRERSFDTFYAVFPRKTEHPNVLVVDIDDATLALLGSWPLPRSRLVELMSHVTAARPSVTVFDIFFPAADRHAARTLANELAGLPGGAAIKALVVDMPDADADFAAALRSTPSVIGALAGPTENLPAFNVIKSDRAPDPATATPIEGLLGPYPPLAEAALGIGIQSLWGEEGGTVRRVPLILGAGAAIVPGLALEAARIARRTTVAEVSGRDGRVVLGSTSMRFETGGTMRIHWSGAAHWTQRTLSAVDVIQGRVPSERFAAMVVLVGSSAVEAGALRPSPLGPLTPSVQIQADAIEQVLAGSAPFRSSWAGWIDLSACVGLGLVAAFLATMRGPVLGILSVLAIVVAWLSTAVASFETADLLIDPIWPGLVALMAGNVAGWTDFARTRRIKTLITRRFEQYLAPDLVREIVRHPERLKRYGEMRNVTALFTDIEGFTNLTSQVEPKRLIALLDPYFDGVCRIVTAHGGMVDHIVGDAVHAFFNMPLDLPDHADAAIDCAVAIVGFAETFRRTPDGAAANFGRTRIGIESGAAIVGDVGGPGRFNYTAYGGVINAAARLEAANKTFGTMICVGPGTAGQARRATLRLIGKTELRGFPVPVDAYTPDAVADLRSPERKPP